MSAVAAPHRPSSGVVPSTASSTASSLPSVNSAVKASTSPQTVVPSTSPPGGTASGPTVQSSSHKSSSSRPQQPSSSKTKHRKINKQHPEFELTYDMMLGIRTVVSKTEAQSHSEVNEKDYSDTIKLQFPGRGSVWTPAHRLRDFKFKDYSPVVYKKIRECFGINPADYLLCVCGNFQFLEFISNSKSGQFFFYTHDRQFMIKTVSQGECKFLQTILPAYYEHIVRNPHTLLTRFFGMHRVKPHKKKQRHFLIMSSVFYTDKYIHTVFDLKGSTQGRSATAKEIRSGNPVYKDNDFVQQKMAMKLSELQSERLQQQLASDVEFLRKLDIMDYSLLLGVHYRDRPVPAVDRPPHAMEMTRSGGYSLNEKDRGVVMGHTSGLEKSSRDVSINGGATGLQVITPSDGQQPRGSSSVVDGRPGESELQELNSDTDDEGGAGKRPSRLMQLHVPAQHGETETNHPSPSPVSHSVSSQLALDEHKQPESQAKAETVINRQPATLRETQRNPAVLLPPLAVNTATSTSSASHASPVASSSPVDIPSPVPEEAGSPPDSSPLSVDHPPAWHSEPDESPGKMDSDDDDEPQREPGEQIISPHSQHTLNIDNIRALHLRDLHLHVATGEAEEEHKTAPSVAPTGSQPQTQPDAASRAAATSLSATQPLQSLSHHRPSLSVSLNSQPIVLHLPADGHGQNHYHTEDLSHLHSHYLSASAPPTQRSASVNLPHLLTVPTTPATSATVQSSPINHPHSPVSVDYNKRQSTYGLPKRWNKTTKPSDIDFDAPEFEPLPVTAALDSPRHKRDRASIGAVADIVERSTAKNTAGVRGEEAVAAASGVESSSSWLLNEHGGVGSADGKEIYFMGIIDILTVYTVSKFMENRYKRARLQKGISAVSPRKYAERFKEFIAKGIHIVSGSAGRGVNGVAR